MNGYGVIDEEDRTAGTALACFLMAAAIAGAAAWCAIWWALASGAGAFRPEQMLAMLFYAAVLVIHGMLHVLIVPMPGEIIDESEG